MKKVHGQLLLKSLHCVGVSGLLSPRQLPRANLEVNLVLTTNMRINHGLVSHVGLVSHTTCNG